MRRAALALPLSIAVVSMAAEPRTELWFEDVTERAGIDFRHVAGESPHRRLPETMGAGGCALDFDGDGRIDVYLVQSGALEGDTDATNRLFRNRGDGTFEDVTAATNTGDPGYGQGAVCADFDGDGDTDVYVTNFGPNVLYRNDGGVFRDVAQETGTDDPSWSVSAAFFDAEPDGDLDLYVANYLDYTLSTHVDCVDRARGVVFYCHPDTYPARQDRFYRNRGDGTFEDATASSGFVVPDGKGLGVVAADLDDDGRTDVYVANDSTPNFLFRNVGDGRFEEIGLVAGVAVGSEGKSEAGMGIDVGDADGDGRLDLFVTNLGLEPNGLYRNRGDMDFRHATSAARLHVPSFPVLGFATELLDLDNDGDLDILVANGDVLDNAKTFRDATDWRQPGQVFLNDGRGVFHELPASSAGPLAVPRVGRGAFRIDFDDDGRLDWLVSHSRDRARLYRNVTSSEAHWIGFDLGSAAPGTRVTVSAGGRVQVEQHLAGSSYASSGDPRLHFGLGEATSADRVEIRWSTGERQSLTDLPANRYHRITRSSETSEPPAGIEPATY